MSREKSAVLFIATHGETSLKKGDTGVLEPVLTPIPSDMDVVVIQAAVCGAPNIVTKSNVESYIDAIKDETYDLHDDTTKEDMLEIANSIKMRLMQIDKPTRSIIAKGINSRSMHFVNNPEFRDYRAYDDRTYMIHDKETIIDKEFSRLDGLTTPSSKFLKVSLLGENDEDLMETLNERIYTLRNSKKRKRKADIIIHMRDIFSEFEKRGIKKALIVDVSCSSISNHYASERDTRSARNKSVKAGKSKSKLARRTRSRQLNQMQAKPA